MRNVAKSYVLAALLLSLSSIASFGQDPAKPTSTPPRSVDEVKADDSAIKAAFNERVNEYVHLHHKIDASLPKLSTEATAEQIGAHKAALLAGVKEARKGSKRGDIFTADTIAMFRRIVRELYSDAELAALRKDIVEAENKGIPIAVNAAYPEGKEKPEIPARLLLALPQLPKEVQYRFVGENMMIVDKQGSLIIDYMTNILP